MFDLAVETVARHCLAGFGCWAPSSAVVAERVVFVVEVGVAAAAAVAAAVVVAVVEKMVEDLVKDVAVADGAEHCVDERRDEFGCDEVIGGLNWAIRQSFLFAGDGIGNHQSFHSLKSRWTIKNPFIRVGQCAI